MKGSLQDTECMWLELRLVNTKLIVMGLIYWPPSGKIEKFMEHLEDICVSLRSQQNCEINFGGDVNIDLYKRDVRKRKLSTQTA